MADLLDDPEIGDEPLYRAIGDRYLQYALSIIMDRALPDARDGLKPVQRRILYAMRELKLGPSSGFRKCAKISGDVMGNYHPHGDQAIYDALARLAQDFNVRYPLIEGQGNFGNIDGDRPASSRYTEARLTFAAEMLMDGLDEDAVEFRPNYDDTLQEPIVLPGTYPNLLANGSSGIAVGMATNIPPHNIGELCEACLHLIKHPNAYVSTLAQIVPGPDFPTGGVIVSDQESLSGIYAEGKGMIRVRSRWQLEKLPRGQWQVVITEIPYQVKKSKLIEGIAKLIQDKKITLLSDVRDESADDVRIILEPRISKTEPEVLMEALFSNSELESRFSLNMNALVDGQTPRVSSLRDLLWIYLRHRRTVLVRRAEHRIGKIDDRLLLIEGFLVAFLNLDRVIAIIRFEDHPKSVLIEEFDLEEIQAEAILNMRLRSLRKLEEIELTNEQEELVFERSELDDLVNSEELQWQRISIQLKDTAKRFEKSRFGKRRTTFAKAPKVDVRAASEVAEAMPITVVCSTMGWIRSYKGELDLEQEFKYRDGDSEGYAFHAKTTDRLGMLGSNGRFYTLSASALPSGKGMGQPVRLLAELPNEADVIDLRVQNPDESYLLLSRNGLGFIVDAEHTVSRTRNGKIIFNAKQGDRPYMCLPVVGDHVAMVSTNKRMLILPIDDIPQRNTSAGVILQVMKSSQLSDAKCFSLEAGLSWTIASGAQRKVRNIENWIGKRATRGRKVPRGFPKTNRFS